MSATDEKPTGARLRARRGAARLGRALSRLRAAQAGFSLIEVMLSVTVVTTAMTGAYVAFGSAAQISLIAERHATLAHVAQREIERVEGLTYASIGLTSAPAPSSDPSSPDYYVESGSPLSFEYDRIAGTTEPLDVDTTSGAITPVQSWAEGQFTGQIYDFVTWTTDPKCGAGCPSSQDYKRITVVVTMTGGVQPAPVWLTSIVADPRAAPAGGTYNGSVGNPLQNPDTQCVNSGGQVGLCTAGIDNGNGLTFFLHDWGANNSGNPVPPSASHATHSTVGVLSGLTCTTTQALVSILSDVAGCPVPDLMDSNAPTGSTLYQYSTDVATSGYTSGQVLEPTCSNGTQSCSGAIGSNCGGSGCGGTGSSSDCNNETWSANLLDSESHMWVSSPVTATTTLTGWGGLSMYTQTLNSLQALVTFCVEIYDIPPSGSSGSVTDLIAYPPTALGGAAYVAPTDPQTGGNWPTGPSETSFVFNFRGSGGSVAIAPGHRIGVMVWIKANLNVPIALLYDNAAYPTQLQLNSQ